MATEADYSGREAVGGEEERRGMKGAGEVRIKWLNKEEKEGKNRAG